MESLKGKSFCFLNSKLVNQVRNYLTQPKQKRLENCRFILFILSLSKLFNNVQVQQEKRQQKHVELWKNLQTFEIFKKKF